MARLTSWLEVKVWPIEVGVVFKPTPAKCIRTCLEEKVLVLPVRNLKLRRERQCQLYQGKVTTKRRSCGVKLHPASIGSALGATLILGGLAQTSQLFH